MRQRRRRVVVGLFAALLALHLSASGVFAYDDYDPGYGRSTSEHRESRGGYNDEYLFAATRAVNDLDMSPALKVTLVPPAVIVDALFLPIAAFAGIFG